MASPVSGNSGSHPPSGSMPSPSGGRQVSRWQTVRDKFTRKAATEKEYGLFKALRVLFKKFKGTESLRAMTGLGLREGVPRALEASFFVPPFGWLVGGLAHLGPKQWAARHGQKLIEKAQAADPKGVPGLLASAEDLRTMWRDPNRFHKLDETPKVHVWKSWIDKYNDMLSTAFKDDKLGEKEAKEVEKALRRLQIKEEKFVGRSIRNHFLVKLEYGKKGLGRFLNFLLRNEVANRHTTNFAGKTANLMLRPLQFLRRIPVIKWPFLATGTLLQSGLMWRAARQFKAGKLNHWT